MTQATSEAFLEPKQLIDDIGNFKELASLAEIAARWTTLFPEEFEEVALNLFVRARDRDFEFEVPKEEFIEESYVVGNGLTLRASDIKALYYGVEKAVENRCASIVRKNREYEEVDYESIFSELSRLDLGELQGSARGEI